MLYVLLEKIRRHLGEQSDAELHSLIKDLDDVRTIVEYERILLTETLNRHYVALCILRENGLLERFDDVVRATHGI